MINELHINPYIRRVFTRIFVDAAPNRVAYLKGFMVSVGLLCTMIFVGCAAPLQTRIILKSTPPGAVVTEAELGEVGVTNMEYFLDHQKYAYSNYGNSNDRCLKSFVFTLPGYAPERIDKEIIGEEVTIHALMKYLKTKLEIERIPGFAMVRLSKNGQIVDYEGKTPHGLKLDDPSLYNEQGIGLFDLEISAPGYVGLETTVELRKGRKQELSYMLSEKKAVVYFRTIPEGVDVYDRSLGYLGRTPFSIVFPGSKLIRVLTRPDLSLNRAQLQLSFQKDGFRTVELVRDIRVGEELENIIEVDMK